MPPFNQSAWDVFEELHGASGQPDHEVVAGTDWVAVGGGGGCVKLFSCQAQLRLC